MMIAGIGCRKGATADSVLAAFAAACAAAGVEPGSVTGFATATAKSGEVGIVAAAQSLQLTLAAIEPEAMQAVADRSITRSQRVIALMQVPSVAETAALAAAGSSSRLLGPRQASGEATCALAVAGAAP
jgi:cobalt-precorrin 5A hydrolase